MAHLYFVGLRLRCERSFGYREMRRRLLLPSLDHWCNAIQRSVAGAKQIFEKMKLTRTGISRVLAPLIADFSDLAMLQNESRSGSKSIRKAWTAYQYFCNIPKVHSLMVAMDD